MTRLLLVVILVLSAPVAAHAITVTPTTVGADVTYQEPSTNANGTPLQDLGKCNAFAQPSAGAELKFSDIAASALTGGANRSVSITVPKGDEYMVTVSCTDTTGNESGRSIPKKLDGLPPAAPK